MATKKIEEAEKQEVATPDEDGRVAVFVPRGNPDDPGLWVSVNDYAAVLPRGKTSMVPKFVADEIERARKAEDAFWDLSADLQKQQ